MTGPIAPDWDVTKQSYPVGAITEGTVVKRAVFGVFVQLSNGAVGQIEAPELGDKSLRPEDFPNLGEVLRARVLGHRDANQQLILTTRHV